VSDWFDDTDFLEDVGAITEQGRENDYGHPGENFGRIAEIWSAVLGTSVSPRDVARCMIGMKISRDCTKPKRDNMLDAAGYAYLTEALPDDEVDVTGFPKKISGSGEGAE